ncbi:uncharacterized protein E0L32_011628 [Thyridium curvatum]|uniref:Uncharacterized protein n=1 Tax=Thyridium curvatum TaxID=1093900 RepID=A0A507BG22_9PEZI|nr:uncharacterized protein E0L32_011628 [Thyridium curvatum]TPX18443.1 hypothetical protein E0L32_011628 [Thyridium curvatum]
MASSKKVSFHDLPEKDEWDFVEDVFSRTRPPQHKAANLSSVQAAAASADEASDAATVSRFSILSLREAELPLDSDPATEDSNKSHPDTEPNTLATGSDGEASRARLQQLRDTPSSPRHTDLTMSMLDLHGLVCPACDSNGDIVRWLGTAPGLLYRSGAQSATATVTGTRAGPRSRSNFSDASFGSNAVPVQAADEIPIMVRDVGVQFGSTPVQRELVLDIL